MYQAKCNFKETKQSWSLIHRHYKKENEKHAIFRITATVQAFVRALVLSMKNEQFDHVDSLFDGFSDSTIALLINSKTEDILKGHKLLDKIYEALADSEIPDTGNEYLGFIITSKKYLLP